MIRQWIEKFWLKRLTPRDSTTLNQRNVYILPTRPGWAMAVTIAVLLIASINYQLNLGYLLTFLLAGSVVVGMHVCHGTLRGITMNMVAPEPQFAGTGASITVQLVSQRRRIRHGIGLAVWGSDHWSWTDVPAQGSTKVQIGFKAERRGLHNVPPLTAETRFPLGTFRVWTVWRPAARVLVYPAIEAHAPPLPAGEPRSGGAASQQRSSTGEFDGVRAYRRGDPLKTVVWKKAAKNGELVSRDTLQVQGFELWLDLAHTGSFGGGAATLEARLSRLCAWVLSASKNELPFGLRLPSQEIAPSTGEAHKKACLQALALYPGAQG
jgi:uncharacterized protein (DUF58 family)